ncbi:MAG: hypothetical protein EOO46_10340 [Flavobacterium sp.]|nr:MAG: hypothetical protein EOO46_10340 [Flavobacterium sp.]
MHTKKSKAKSQKSKVETGLLFFLASFFFSLETNAQCAMCRAVLETEEGGVKAEAVNDGIVYLMAFPYVLVGILGYVIYRTRQKKKA